MLTTTFRNMAYFEFFLLIRLWCNNFTQKTTALLNLK